MFIFSICYTHFFTPDSRRINSRLFIIWACQQKGQSQFFCLCLDPSAYFNFPFLLSGYPLQLLAPVGHCGVSASNPHAERPKNFFHNSPPLEGQGEVIVNISNQATREVSLLLPSALTLLPIFSPSTKTALSSKIYPKPKNSYALRSLYL